MRVIAATHAHLEEAIKLGRFREDLYYRLTSRRSCSRRCATGRRDISLWRTSSSNVSVTMKSPSSFLPRARAADLLEHAWPGNVRELENVIRYALLVCQGNTIDVHDLRISSPALPARPRDLRRPVLLEGGRAATGHPDGATIGRRRYALLENALAALFEENLPALTQRIDQTVFRAAFRYCHRNQLQTARLLGVTRNVVRARLIEAGELARASRLARVPRGTSPLPPRPTTIGHCHQLADARGACSLAMISPNGPVRLIRPVVLL